MRRIHWLAIMIVATSLTTAAPSDADQQLFADVCRESLGENTAIFELRLVDGTFRFGTHPDRPAICDYVRFQGPLTEVTITDTWYDQILSQSEVEDLCSGQEFAPVNKAEVEIAALGATFGVDSRIRGTSQELVIDIVELESLGVIVGEGVFHRIEGLCDTTNPTAKWKGSLVIGDPQVDPDDLLAPLAA